MPKPIALCIEDLDAGSGASKYVRCVALPGREPGLGLDGRGAVLWRSEEPVACELWVSGDDRLILYRLEGAADVTLSRAGRSLDVPSGKPVVLIDQDQIDVGPRCLRLHVHGEAPAVAAPSPLVPEKKSPGLLARVATAALALGSIVGCGSCEDEQQTPREPIEVRDSPPKVAPPESGEQEESPNTNNTEPGQGLRASKQKSTHRSLRNDRMGTQ